MRMTWIEKLETAVIVTLVTVLIWLWAEGQNVQLYANQTVQVQFVPQPGQEANMAVLPREPREVELSFTTSAEQYAQFQRLITEGPIQIPVSPGQPGTVQTFVTQNLLQEHLLNRLGIAVQQADPSTLTADARALQTVSVPVQVETPPGVFVDIREVQPSQVEVRLPRELAAMAVDEPVRVSLQQRDLAGLPGEPRRVTAPVTLPPQLRSPMSESLTREVTVEYVVRRQTDTTTLQSVPIYIQALPLLLRRYRVLLPADQQFVRDVVLTGPSDVIEQIRDGEVDVRAVLSPTREEIEQGVRSLPVAMSLPPGVELQSPLPVVNFEVVDVPAPVGGAAP